MADIHTLASRSLSFILLLGIVIFTPLHASQMPSAASRRVHVVAGSARRSAAEITSATASRATYLPGDSITVEFTTSGAFNNGNVFAAQISGRNGSFAQARPVGVLESTSQGVIAGKLPCDLIPGTGYRIRVVATNPAATGPDNGADITILSHPVLTLTPPDTIPLCAGDSVTITANSGYRSYRWNNGDTTQSITVHTQGIFTLTATDFNECGYTARVTVFVNPLPKDSVRWIGLNTLLIDSTFASYQWYFAPDQQSPMAPISGATSYRYLASQEGYYSVRITSGKGCSGVSDTLHFISEGVDWISARDAGVAIYPRPVRERFMVETQLERPETVELSVVDVSGREVLRREPERVDGAYRREISLAGAPAGTYLLRLDIGERHVVEKIVKE